MSIQIDFIFCENVFYTEMIESILSMMMCGGGRWGTQREPKETHGDHTSSTQVRVEPLHHCAVFIYLVISFVLLVSSGILT